MIVGDVSCKTLLPLIYGTSVIDLIVTCIGMAIIIALLLVIFSKLKG